MSTSNTNNLYADGTDLDILANLPDVINCENCGRNRIDYPMPCKCESEPKVETWTCINCGEDMESVYTACPCQLHIN